MFKPQTLTSPESLTRLGEAIHQSEQVMNEFRTKRMEALKEYLGAHYSSDGCSVHNPINLLWLWVKIHMQSLAARQPRVLATTSFVEYKPTASNLELALDVLMRKIRFGDSLRLCVMEAFFGIGAMYTGLNQSDTCKIGGITHAVGQPFCDPIFLDEFFMDMSSRTIEQVQFMGHSYLIPQDEYHNCGLFEDIELATAEKGPTGFGGTEKSETLSTGGRSMSADYKKFYRLRNVWLPLDGPQGVMITVEDNQDGIGASGILREVEWDGPGNGPYRVLRFNEVPGNIMPLPPIANLLDLHRLENSLFRKLEASARNQKDILTFQGGSEKDAERVVASDHMDTVRVDNVGNLKPMSFNGVDPRQLAFATQVKDIFSWAGGNLDSLGGLSPMSSTVGQDKLLGESASKQVADMQRSVVDFTTDLVRDLAWWLWTDPLIHIPLTKRVRGTSIEIATEFSARTRTGDFLDYNINIDPYSMTHSTPQMKLAAIKDAIQNLYVPLIQQATEQGVTIDIRNLFKIFGKYSDAPEIYEIITALESPIRPDSGPVGDKPSKAPVTQRSYIREDRPAPTRPNRDNALIQTLLGGGVQQAEGEMAV